MPGLLVVQTAYLGDMVMTTPLLRELRRVRPADRICLVTTPDNGALLAGSPFVDDSVRFDKRGGMSGIGGLIRVVRTLRARGAWDVAVAAQRSHRTGVLVRASGAPVRIGFEGAAGAWAYTDRVGRNDAQHAIDRYLELSRPLGGSPERAERRPSLPLSALERDEARAVRAGLGVVGDRPLACVAPGSNWTTKRWSSEGFATIARRLVRRGYDVVVVGTSGERALCERVAETAGAGSVSLAGALGIRQFVATLAQAAVTVANDSGPAHVAAAFGAPVVSVFGPTSPTSGLVPFGDDVHVVEHPDLDCRPCSRHGPVRCPLGHFRCMRELGVERVWDAVETAVAGREAVPVP